MIKRTYNHYGIAKQAVALYDHIYDVADAFKASSADDHGLFPTVIQLSNTRLDSRRGTTARILDDFDGWTEHYELARDDYALLASQLDVPATYDRLRANLVTQRIIYARYPDIKAADFIRKEKARLFEEETQGL